MHVAVVGAGAFGGWTAYALLQSGIQVTLLDAWGAGHTASSSGGESRILRCVYGTDRRYAAMTMEALKGWKEFSARWDTPCFQRLGAVWLFSGGDQRYLREALPFLRELGWPMEEVEPQSLSARFPALSVAGVERAWLEPEAGLLHARLATQKVAAACRALGADYRLLAARPGPISGGTLRELRLSDGSRLQADAYVFACGPWLPVLFPEVCADTTGISRQEVYFFKVPPGDHYHKFPALPIWLEFGETLFYGLPLDNSRGFKVADDDRSQPFEPDRDDRLPRPWRLNRARRFLTRRFPGLANAPLQESRVCQYLNSRDGHFIIDRHPEARNLWLAGAGSGHGFKMGPAIGAYLRAQLLGDSPPEPDFSIGRFANPHRDTFNQFVVE